VTVDWNVWMIRGDNSVALTDEALPEKEAVATAERRNAAVQRYGGFTTYVALPEGERP